MTKKTMRMSATLRFLCVTAFVHSLTYTPALTQTSDGLGGEKSTKIEQAASALTSRLNAYTSKIMLDGKRWLTQNLNIKVTGSYCYDDKETNCSRYGRLYTWEAARQACGALGDGWRLPTNDEWREMAKRYGGIRGESEDNGKSAYKALIEGGSAEFNALLGGGRGPDGQYLRLDGHGFYWSATESDMDHAWFFNFGKGSQLLGRHNDGEKPRAFAVRCVKAIATPTEN